VKSFQIFFIVTKEFFEE